MLSGLHDYTEETLGAACEFSIHGPTDDVLELVRLLKENEGTREVPLQIGSEDPHPYAGFLETLVLETIEKSRLLIQRTGSPLKIGGAGECMEALSEDIHHAAQLVGERSGDEPHHDDVIVEIRNEPYMDANPKSLCVETYEAK